MEKYTDNHDHFLTDRATLIMRAIYQLSARLLREILGKYSGETLGEWDFEVGLECSQASVVMNIVASLYESFPAQIANIRSVTELETLKFTMFPSS